jgi:hypothetical protein
LRWGRGGIAERAGNADYAERGFSEVPVTSEVRDTWQAPEAETIDVLVRRLILGVMVGVVHCQPLDGSSAAQAVIGGEEGEGMVRSQSLPTSST